MPSPSSAPDLPRVLGVWHATAIVVGTIIGSGIFLVPEEMMRAVGSGRMVYLAWIVGGLLTLFGAMTYAELGAMMPQAGGNTSFSETLTASCLLFSTCGPGLQLPSRRRSPASPLAWLA
jgi:amino acid transporter